MAEPLVFSFAPGPGGRPNAMYMLDLDCCCDLCGFEQFQRFYHSTAFHSLTLLGLEELVDRGPLKAGYQCENCGDAVGADQVRHVVLAYGFADDAGVIRIFDEVGEQRRRFEVTPRRRLDPQTVPRWSADPDAFGDGHCVIDDLREDDVVRLLGRPFNPKLAIRDRLQDWLAEPGKPVCTKIADGMWLVIAADAEASKTASKQLDAGENTHIIALSDSAPKALPTHAEPNRLTGRWSTWLPDSAADAVAGGSVAVDFHLSPAPAIDAIRRTFEVGRLNYERHDGDDGPVFTAIETPRDQSYGADLRVADVLRRAAHTGITPGESGRLCAEEIVGDLLQVW